eukprot:5880289-Amphidinium_carterae.1
MIHRARRPKRENSCDVYLVPRLVPARRHCDAPVLALWVYRELFVRSGQIQAAPDYLQHL